MKVCKHLQIIEILLWPPEFVLIRSKAEYIMPKSESMINQQIAFRLPSIQPNRSTSFI
jgi:hypothetical protein